MNAKRLSITVIAGALLALMLAPGFAAAQPQLESSGTSEGIAHFQIVKEATVVTQNDDVVLDYDMSKFLEENMLGIHSVLDEQAVDAVLDYQAMRFLEENTLGYHVPTAQYAQADTADSIQAFAAPCQGEGLVGDALVRSGITGTVGSYCSGEVFADSLGTRTDDVVPAPQPPFDANQGFTEY